MFNVAVDWNEEGVSLGSATLPQSAPVTVAELKQQCQKEFQLPPAQQTLASRGEGRRLDRLQLELGEHCGRARADARV